MSQQNTAEWERMDRIARICHEVNRAYCAALGDLSQPAWEDAPEWQRASARMGVDLHLMGDFGPEASHLSWMSQKLDEGWTYGEVKDPAAKKHPCMVPFDQLPREQQAKDFIFRAVVHAVRDNSDIAAGSVLRSVRQILRVRDGESVTLVAQQLMSKIDITKSEG